MSKAAIIYSFNTRNSANVAKEIIKEFAPLAITELNAEEIDGPTFCAFDFLILAAPTWFDGELPNYWDEFVPELETLNLKGKKIAIFGTGDQKGYPENFLDAVGILADIVELRGAEIIGKTSVDGYTFESSKAVRENQFLGLGIDFENQSQLNSKRIKNWVQQLKTESGLK